MTGIQPSLPIKTTPIVTCCRCLKGGCETQMKDLNLLASAMLPTTLTFNIAVSVSVCICAPMQEWYIVPSVWPWMTFHDAQGVTVPMRQLLTSPVTTTHRRLYLFTSAVPEAISTNLLRGCLNGEVNLSPWNGGQDSNLRWRLGFITLLLVSLTDHILYGRCLTT